ncbi:hypothetical protein O181_112358, partial [Austropuccinia psidii MF-1]|nr:hypothetical protein [Austropuccinia psidii MF-1]
LCLGWDRNCFPSPSLRKSAGDGKVPPSRGRGERDRNPLLCAYGKLGGPGRKNGPGPNPTWMNTSSPQIPDLTLHIHATTTPLKEAGSRSNPHPNPTLLRILVRSQSRQAPDTQIKPNFVPFKCI